MTKFVYKELTSILFYLYQLGILILLQYPNIFSTNMYKEFLFRKHIINVNVKRIANQKKKRITQENKPEIFLG